MTKRHEIQDMREARTTAEIELYEFYRLNGLGARPCDQIVCAECESILQ